MGTHTNVIHPKDGHKLQIKTGYSDDCDTYRVGDEVTFFVDKNVYGYGGIFDGVYDSYSDKGVDDWVIIKGRKVIKVVSKRNNRDSLIKKYGIKEPSRKLWTKEAYAKYVARNKSMDEENKKFMKNVAHLPREQRLAAVFARPLMKRMNYEGFARKILKVEPLEKI